LLEFEVEVGKALVPERIKIPFAPPVPSCNAVKGPLVKALVKYAASTE
jgi:hypothetical protein